MLPLIICGSTVAPTFNLLFSAFLAFYCQRIVNAINSKRAALGNDWDHILRYESGEVKRRVDPFRTVDLNSYLKVAPFVGGAGYLAALLVQKSLPELFVFAYPIAVAALVVPALFIAVFS